MWIKRLNQRAGLTQRWQQLGRREQRALLGLGGFLLATTLYGGLWQPLHQALALAQQQLRVATLQHSQLAQLPVEAGQAPPAIAPNELPGLLARSSQQAGLNLQRLDHEAEGQVSLALEGPLSSVIIWLDQLELRQVQVLSLALEVNPHAIASVQLQVQAR